MSTQYETDNIPYPEDLKLSDHLALKRTKLANERTFLSYTRSSIYLATAGIAFWKMKDFANMDYIAEICLISSGIILITGISRFVILNRQIKNLYLPKPKSKKD